MAVVELIPVSERDEAIFQAWETGKGLRTLAREFGIPVAEIERAIDRLLPSVDAQHGLYAYKRELRRLEDLSSQFFAIAKRDDDRDCAHLVARLNERIAAMRGWSSISIRIGSVGSAGRPRAEQLRKDQGRRSRLSRASAAFQRQRRSCRTASRSSRRALTGKLMLIIFIVARGDVSKVKDLAMV